MQTANETPPVRLDKWLWAARFFKTRRLATDAITGGKVHLNGQRCKPSRTVRPGDQLRIRKGPVTFEITVQALSAQRGPASSAIRLYRETDESITERKRIRSGAQAQPLPLQRPRGTGRPTKRERRQLDQWQPDPSAEDED